MLPILNSGRVELLDHPRLATQLTGLERRTARSGKDSIDHAPGGHDDVANAVAGALMLAAFGRQSMKISPEALRRFSVPAEPSYDYLYQVRFCKGELVTTLTQAELNSCRQSVCLSLRQVT